MRLLALFSCICLVVSAQDTQSFAEIAAKAAAARDANNIPQAIELYRKGVQLNAQWEEGWWYLGSMLYDSDQYGPAVDALKHVVQGTPNATPAWALLGLSEFETGQYDKSLEHIEHALAPGASLPPEMEAVLRFHEALLLTRKGDFDKAVQAYAWFGHKGAANEDILEAAGLAAMHVSVLPKQVPADQREVYSMAGRAAFQIMSGDYTGAQQIFQQMLQRYPRTPNVHYMYATFLLAAAPDIALREFKQELEISPSSGGANAMLAWLMEERGDDVAALPYAEQAARIEPSVALSHYVLGRALAARGDLQRAISQLEEAAKMDPSSLDDHLALGTVYSRAGRLPEAREQRQIALTMAGKDPQIAQR